MQKTKGGGMQPESADRNEKYHMVVSDLVAVIGRVRNSLELIESEIASEAEGEEASDIIVLDDVTPGYSRAQAALRECEAGLSAALHLLQESTPPGIVPVNS
ncbi:hypothetical protein [Bradyrhizobium sp.]|uniref:hypothetical protein n=1 Tax=Bradyrhizobium sp. TaxID=376 RepID=UPI00403830A8